MSIDFRIAWLVGALVLTYGIVSCANGFEELSIELLLFTVVFFWMRGFLKQWTKKDQASTKTPSRRGKSSRWTLQSNDDHGIDQSDNCEEAKEEKSDLPDLEDLSAEELKTHIAESYRFHNCWGWTEDARARLAFWEEALQRKQG